MTKIDSALFQISALDDLAQHDTPIHRRDPRAKLLATAVFIFCVVSFGRYEFSSLLPYILFPMMLMSQGKIPAGILFTRLLLVAPFALLVAAPNPFLDREVLLRIGPIPLSAGWISFFSIELRFLLTVNAALLLVATTGFSTLALAFERLGAPRIFILQLLFLYRYLSVLIEEAARLTRARALRSFNGHGSGIKVYGNMIGQLLLRTLERARRIHLAMLCRGFDGQIRLYHPFRFGPGDLAFLLGWSALFVTFRFAPLPHILGKLLLELAP